MLWHEQNWPAIQAMDKQIPVLIPLGSCEQHGHHLPLFVDSIQVEAIARGVEERLTDRLLLMPTLWFGCSHHHMDFPGTVSAPPSLYEQMIKQLASSVLAAGFTRLFFLNGHGGNLLPAATALTELANEDERADEAHIVLGSWWDVAGEAMQADQHGMTTAQLTHACEYETSLLLALRPDLVHMARIDDQAPETERPWTRYGPGLQGFRRFHRFTAHGHMGQPVHASAQKGQSLQEAIIEQITSCLQDFARWPAMPVIGPTS